MNIVYCIDERYIELTKKSIASILKFNPKANIIIVSENPISEFKEYTNYQFNLSKYSFKQRTQNDRITKASYLRIFLPEILPFAKCLYLDGDIICQKPLKSLYDMDCEYINACESHNYGKTQAKELNVNRYALTGMMLMNLENLIKDNFTQKCLEYQNYGVSLWCHDETLINGAYNSKIKFIDKKFNYCHNREYDNPILENEAYILHYVGGHKKINEIPNIKDEYINIPEVKEFIKDKRVAIVGNALSIFDKKNGNLIDYYDIVVRFNYGFIKNAESQGTKTDIHIVAVNLKSEECELLKCQFRLNRSRICHNPCKTILWADRKRLIQNNLQPSSGFMAIDLCLSSKAKEIGLFGFDFGKTQSFPNPPDYKTLHDFESESRYVKVLENAGLLDIL